MLLRTWAGIEVERILLEAELDAHAPQLIDAEVAGALRRRERRGRASAGARGTPLLTTDAWATRAVRAIASVAVVPAPAGC